MKNGKKRALLLLLSLLLSCLSLLVSCADEPVNEAEFVLSAKDLLKRAEKINNAYLTEAGIPVKIGGKVSGKYAEIDKQGLQSLGFNSLAEIDAEIGAVFDSSTAKWFDIYMNETEGYEQEKYRLYAVIEKITYEKLYDGNGKPYDKKVVTETEMRYTGSFDYISDIVTFDESSVAFKGVSQRNRKQIATVTVNVTVTNKNGKSEIRENQEFDFVRENGEWKLCEAVYYPYLGN